MTTLTLNFPPDLYQRLSNESSRLGKSPQVMVLEWVSRQLFPAPPVLTERERFRQILHQAGLLTELSPSLRQLADPTISLTEVLAFMGEAGGPSLSELVLAQRQAKAW